MGVIWILLINKNILEIITFPNPVSDQLTVLVKQPLKQLIIEIYDVQGKIVTQHEFKSNNIFYDDTVLKFPLHKLKLGEIIKCNYSINKLLPKEVIEYCNKIDINEF